jgi:type 1 glutamine amidotransferase
MAKHWLSAWIGLAILLAVAAWPVCGDDKKSAAPAAKAEIDPYDQSGVPLEVEPTDPKLTRIVLVAGRASHGPLAHEFFAGTTILFNMLKQTPGVFPIMARDGWPKNPKIFEGAKSTVFYMDGRGGHPIIKPDRMEMLQKLMDQGAGFVNLHYAVDYPAKQGETILGWMGGYYDAAISTNPHWKADFRSLPDHPITRGVKPFAIDDEWYFNMRFVEGLQDVTPILRAVPPDNKRGTADAKKYPGREEIVAWAYDRPGGGRGFGFTGGHNHRNWGDENFRRLVVNAILWSAKVEVPKDGARVDFDPADLNRNLDRKGKK